MNKLVKNYVLQVLVWIALLNVCVPAQTDTSSISGFLRDASEAGVPGALVTARNEVTGLERSAKTDSAGFYAIPNLPPGFYTVTAEATGFRRTEVRRNKLDAAVPLQVSVSLSVGQLEASVEVVAKSNEVQADTATLGRVVTREQVENLQLNGRNPALLAQLMPGVTRRAPISSFTFGLESQFNINGSRDRDNMMTIDGAPAVRTRAATFPVGVADVDSTQEVQILTANYRAEYGRSAGGQIRIVTRSGSKEFHGSAFEYFRNAALDANSWSRNASRDRDTARRPAPFVYNQFGFNLSGPVWIPGLKFNQEKNKLFWLYGLEFTRFRQTQTATRLVPSEAMRRGDFSELLGSNLYYGRTVQLRDPLTGDPFPGNIIPTNRLSPNGLGLLRAFTSPTPGFNLGGANALLNIAAPQNQRKDTVSLDYIPSEKHSFRVRYLNHDYEQYAPFRGNYDRGRRWLIWDNQVASATHTWTIAPTMVNELVVSLTLDRVLNVMDRTVNTFDRRQYSINFPYLFPVGKARPEFIPNINVAGLIALSSNQEGRTSGPIYALSDNFTKVLGRHILKAGIYFERAGQNEGGGAIENGTFNFTDTRTGAPTSGVALANVALGLFDSYNEIGRYNYVPYRGHMVEYYLQDSWKATTRLQLEYGLRHSLIQPYYSLFRNTAYFDPRFYDPARAAQIDRRTGVILGGDPLNGMVIPGRGFTDSARGRISVDPQAVQGLFRGVDKGFSRRHWTDLQPRVGLAYLLTPNTVVRAAAGHYVLRPPIPDVFNAGLNPPFQPSAFVTNGSVDDPSGGQPLSFPTSPSTQDAIYPNTSSWMWNATAERSLPGSILLSVGYVGRRGLHLMTLRNINQLATGAVQANPGVNQNALRPFKGYGPILSLNNDGSSKYHALQISATRRYSQGLLFGVAYTLSKSEDDTSTSGEVLPNAFNRASYWGPSAFDSRHVAVINFSYDLPFFRARAGLVRALLGGWQLSGVNQFQTGNPFTVLSGEEFAGVGGGGGAQIWNLNGNAVLSGSERAFANSTAEQNYWFRTTNPDGTPIFTAPAAGIFTTQRNRNRLYAPGFQSWNLSASKIFALTERHRFQFRAEAFNWINHPNWNGPGTNPRNLATFGKVTGKSGERNLQFSLRYSF